MSDPVLITPIPAAVITIIPEIGLPLYVKLQLSACDTISPIALEPVFRCEPQMHTTEVDFAPASIDASYFPVADALL